MFTPTDTQNSDGPSPTAKRQKAPPAPAKPLRLSVGSDSDPIEEVSDALAHAQRRLDNLRDLIDRFDLDGDDDGPRAA